jgi:hypothetical protein
MQTCTTCNRPANAPRTTIEGGRIRFACCDHSHEAYLVPCTSYARFFREFWGRRKPKPIWKELDTARKRSR